jgi:hypothetical protein
MNQLIIEMDNAVTLLRLRQFQFVITPAELGKLVRATDKCLAKIDELKGSPGFDTEAAFKEFFGRPIS